MTSNYYVYGVLEKTTLDLEVAGVEGASHVSTVDYPPFSAVVSDIDVEDPEETDENARAHDDVLQAVMEHGGGHTVVPMQFGMVFDSARGVKNILRGGRRAFTKALRDTEGMVELGVKLVAEQDTDVDTETIREDAAERLATVADEVAEGDLFSDLIVLNRSYLVAREKREAFDEAVDELEADYPDLRVQYTGPWAPYNFVDIEISGSRSNVPHR
ncbi:MULTISPECIES: GvpL/GvpF family gas vesicle protein [unclassified Haladaptatus]|uniref:GvpL/GvpF family gas vesicle protein n=1 Tax=unclassified Haladaptatus TaxID=2622732 RepID=UPI0023E7BF3B|nr:MULTISPECIES: GvpL/GvpF family gas vesicle protein [unclassified Haladaptatus]